VTGEQRAHAVDDRSAKALEGVGHVVVGEPEQEPDQPVCQPVEQQLLPGVVDHSGPGDEARAERAVVALFDLAEVPHDVAGVVGRVGHHDAHDVAGIGVEPRAHRESIAGLGGVLDPAHAGQLLVQAVEHRGRAVAGMIVDDDDLVRYLLAVERRHEGAHRRLERALLVVGGNDDRQRHGDHAAGTLPHIVSPSAAAGHVTGGFYAIPRPRNDKVDWLPK
jgi:hypothetical protein